MDKELCTKFCDILVRFHEVIKLQSFGLSVSDVIPEACKFIKKETLAQVLSCGFLEIFKNTFFTEHLWVTASVQPSSKRSETLNTI